MNYEIMPLAVTKKGSFPIYEFLSEANLLRVPPITITRLLTQILIPIVGLEIFITLLFPLEAMCASSIEPNDTEKQIQRSYIECISNAAACAEREHTANDRIPPLGSEEARESAQIRREINERHAQSEIACATSRDLSMTREHNALSDSKRSKLSLLIDRSVSIGKDIAFQTSLKVEKEPQSPHHVDPSGDPMERTYSGRGSGQGSGGWGGSSNSAFVTPLLEGEDAPSKPPSPATGGLGQIHGPGNGGFEALHALKEKIDLFFDNYIEFVEGSAKRLASFFKR